MINDRPTQLRVNLDALLNNYRKLNALNNKKIGLAIVKADSYGLGSKVIADYLYKNGVRHFATATLEEAIELKDVIKDSMVLVLGVTNPQNVKYAVENNVSLTCPSKEWLEESLVQSQQIEGKLKIHVKIDTGMGRIGTSDLEELKEINNLLDSEKLDFEILSHEVEELSNSFPQSRRRIFNMKYKEGLSVKEIAKILDISPKTVETQLSRIKTTIIKNKGKLL